MGRKALFKRVNKSDHSISLSYRISHKYTLLETGKFEGSKINLRLSMQEFIKESISLNSNVLPEERK